MSFRQVMLAIHGLREKDLYNQALIRRSTMIIASSSGGKKVAQYINKIWPIGENKKGDQLSKAKQLLTKVAEHDDRKRVGKLYDKHVNKNNVGRP